MATSQLPLIASMMMVTQALLAIPVDLRAKGSIGARNTLLLLGFGLWSLQIWCLPSQTMLQLQVVCPPHYCVTPSSMPLLPSLHICTTTLEPCSGQPTVCRASACCIHMRLQLRSEPSSFLPYASMLVGAALVGILMAMSHDICLSMIFAYIPAGYIPGLGRVSGRVWSFTD